MILLCIESRALPPRAVQWVGGRAAKTALQQHGPFMDETAGFVLFRFTMYYVCPPGPFFLCLVARFHYSTIRDRAREP